jgi:hypothetical protein
VKQCVNIRPQNVVKHVSYVEACPRTVLEPRISGDPTITPLPSPNLTPNVSSHLQCTSAPIYHRNGQKIFGIVCVKNEDDI